MSNWHDYPTSLSFSIFIIQALFDEDRKAGRMQVFQRKKKGSKEKGMKVAVVGAALRPSQTLREDGRRFPQREAGRVCKKESPSSFM